MRILGIETSCDETSAAVVEDGRLVRSNVVASQIPIHERFGGVVPEIASRQHVLDVDGVTERALATAGVGLRHLDAIAVTYGPGLSGALMVGVTFAKGLSLAANLPLLAVNHIEGHVLSVWLSSDEPPPPEPELPMISLVVSGGHTELYRVDAPGRYELLGRTRDDAAGEAFDKVGRLLGLPYPGGPSIEAAASTNAASGHSVTAPRAWLPGTYDFSFSGLKTAMVREVRAAQDVLRESSEQDHLQAAPRERGLNAPETPTSAVRGIPTDAAASRVDPGIRDIPTDPAFGGPQASGRVDPTPSDDRRDEPRHASAVRLDEAVVAGLARAFQDSVADVLARKLATAVRETGARSAAIVGGVANNRFIRESVGAAVDVPLCLPGPGLSSDNAAMIAGAAFWSPREAGLDLEVQPSLTVVEGQRH